MRGRLGEADVFHRRLSQRLLKTDVGELFYQNLEQNTS
jgi:hypothetical protein